jgi:IclR family mhp operon transcriptional activator
MQNTPDESYRPVEAIARGLTVLEALSDTGWASISELRDMTGIDRSSLYRIAETLIRLGYVTRREDDRLLALTSKAHRLGEGLKTDDLVAQAVAPHMRALTAKILWPSDFASFHLGAVRIRHSTHRLSPMSVHSRMVGKERSLMYSSLGKAILSAMSEDEIRQASLILRTKNPREADMIANPERVAKAAQEVYRLGYALSVGQSQENISAIAVPLHAGGRLYGAVNIIFFRSSATPAEIAERHLDDLKACAAAAAVDIAALPPQLQI